MGEHPHWKEGELLPWQKEVYYDESRIRVVAAGRRTGQTTLAVYELVRAAYNMKRSHVVYIAPNRAIARQAFEMFREVMPRWMGVVSEVEMKVSQIGYENTVQFLEANTNRLCGVDIALAVIDGATYVDEEFINSLLPTVLGCEGKVLILGTPRPIEKCTWFFNLFRKGLEVNSAKISSFHVSALEAAMMGDIDGLKKELSRPAFLSEVKALFI